MKKIRAKTISPHSISKQQLGRVGSSSHFCKQEFRHVEMNHQQVCQDSFGFPFPSFVFYLPESGICL